MPRQPSSKQPQRSESKEPEGTVVKTNSRFDSRVVRACVSIGLLVYLLIVLLGPLSNPVGSEFLTRPAAAMVAPAHRTLFLGHGYRFFGPDPGASHSVIYRVTDVDGNQTEQRFPDREKIWPRLMYHRWFMLSESVFNELALTPDEKSFRDTDAELEKQIVALRSNGRYALSERMARERKKQQQQYQRARKRIDGLIAAIASHLLRTNDGQHIELFVQERTIPFPVSVLTGEKLNDPKFLSPLTKIGEFRWSEDGELASLEQAPAPDSKATSTTETREQR